MRMEAPPRWLLRDLDRAWAALERIREHLGDEWHDYDYDDLSDIQARIVEAITKRGGK